MIHIEQKDDLNPLCPHCKNELKTIYCKPIEGIWGKRFLYFCSQCKCSLGVSHRKGFWMG